MVSASTMTATEAPSLATMSTIYVNGTGTAGAEKLSRTTSKLLDEPNLEPGENQSQSRKGALIDKILASNASGQADGERLERTHPIFSRSIAFKRAKDNDDAGYDQLRRKYRAINQLNADGAGANDTSPGSLAAGGLRTLNPSAEPPPLPGKTKSIAAIEQEEPHPPNSLPGPPVPSRYLFSVAAIPSDWPHAFRPLRSFVNLGNTCFLNSTLQALVHSPPVGAYLASGHHGRTSREAGKCGRGGWCVTCELERLVQRMVGAAGGGGQSGGGVTGPLHPRGLVDRLKAGLRVLRTEDEFPICAIYCAVIAPHFRPGRQEDAHEFLRYLVEGMQKSAAGGENLDINHCSTLNRALERFTRKEKLTGGERWKCPKCKVPRDAEKWVTIHGAPKVLCVQLKRFGFGGMGSGGGYGYGGAEKLSHRVAFPALLDISPFMSPTSTTSRQPPHWYALTGLVSHRGRSTRSGHYVAYVRPALPLEARPPVRPGDAPRVTPSSWLCYDDEEVRRVGWEGVEGVEAYLLVYVRVDGRGGAPLTPVNGKLVNGAVTALSKGMTRQQIDSGHLPVMDDAPRKPKVYGPELPQQVEPGHLPVTDDAARKKNVYGPELPPGFFHNSSGASGLAHPPSVEAKPLLHSEQVSDGAGGKGPHLSASAPVEKQIPDALKQRKTPNVDPPQPNQREEVSPTPKVKGGEENAASLSDSNIENDLPKCLSSSGTPIALSTGTVESASTSSVRSDSRKRKRQSSPDQDSVGNVATSNLDVPITSWPIAVGKSRWTVTDAGDGDSTASSKTDKRSHRESAESESEDLHSGPVVRPKKVTEGPAVSWDAAEGLKRAALAEVVKREEAATLGRRVGESRAVAKTATSLHDRATELVFGEAVPGWDDLDGADNGGADSFGIEMRDAALVASHKPDRMARPDSWDAEYDAGKVKKVKVKDGKGSFESKEKVGEMLAKRAGAVIEEREDMHSRVASTVIPSKKRKRGPEAVENSDELDERSIEKPLDRSASASDSDSEEEDGPVFPNSQPTSRKAPRLPHSITPNVTSRASPNASISSESTSSTAEQVVPSGFGVAQLLNKIQNAPSLTDDAAREDHKKDLRRKKTERKKRRKEAKRLAALAATTTSTTAPS
ncbi:Ubiquitin carboxyl-terminal hydrolase 36 [Gonapodya sp. JEL0774]|nr:Ubiquitin carboxyl-terminal hydrolase 36 [Gonapodya sp. JEL0774]